MDASSPEASSAFAPAREARAERHPVILVPGAFGQNLVYWNVMQYLLERDGFPVYSVTFPRFTFSDLRESARLLAGKVGAVAASESADRVSLVGHSMGGLIARYYAEVLGGAKSVHGLVCLGTPHRGTYAGLGAPVLMGARQILPGSTFLKELAHARLTAATRITNIYSRFDTVVLPPANARLDDERATNRVTNLAGHWGLLASPRVYRWIREAVG
ncbi:MAG TPA: alpha/beta fold hydrolase [Candidatus Thermoplasmatota archaeon]|nr:alpha/beta fold hydrolase [Candidatus Thermoplasmatota archaeon]